MSKFKKLFTVKTPVKIKISQVFYYTKIKAS